MPTVDLLYLYKRSIINAHDAKNVRYDVIRLIDFTWLINYALCFWTFSTRWQTSPNTRPSWSYFTIQNLRFTIQNSCFRIRFRIHLIVQGLIKFRGHFVAIFSFVNFYLVNSMWIQKKFCHKAEKLFFWYFWRHIWRPGAKKWNRIKCAFLCLKWFETNVKRQK